MPAGERFGRLEAQDKDRRPHRPRSRALSRASAIAPRRSSISARSARRPFTLTHSAEEVESIRGAFITPRSMSWVEASPTLGRNLIPADAETGAERGRPDQGKPVAATLQRRSRHHRPAVDDRRPAPHGRRHHARHVRIPVEPGELWMPLEEATLGARRVGGRHRGSRLRCPSRRRDVRAGDDGSQRACRNRSRPRALALTSCASGSGPSLRKSDAANLAAIRHLSSCS